MTYQIINFDSLNGINNNVYTLPNPLKNVSKIYLKSIELENNINNIRNNNNTFSLASGYDELNKNYINVYTIALQNKLYTDINVLLNDINIQFNLNYPSLNVTLTLENNYIKVSSYINNYNHVFFDQMIVVPTNLSYMLGFRNITDVSPPQRNNTIPFTQVSISQMPYNLFNDNYINLCIKNISSYPTNNNNTLGSFKISLNTNNNNIYTLSENINYIQCININKNDIISNLDIKFIDRYGGDVNLDNVSFSLIFQTENNFILSE